MSTSSAVPPSPALLMSTSRSPNRIEHLLHVSIDGHVTRHCDRCCFPITTASCSGRFGEAPLMLVADRDDRTSSAHPLGGGEADACAGGRGDEHPLAGKQAVPGRVRGGQLRIGHEDAVWPE